MFPFYWKSVFKICLETVSTSLFIPGGLAIFFMVCFLDPYAGRTPLGTAWQSPEPMQECGVNQSSFINFHTSTSRFYGLNWPLVLRLVVYGRFCADGKLCVGAFLATIVCHELSQSAQCASLAVLGHSDSLAVYERVCGGHFKNIRKSSKWLAFYGTCWFFRGRW